MITRRHIRIRVVQSFYSFLINTPSNQHQAKRLLETTLNRVTDLLLLELALFRKIHLIAQEKLSKIQKSMTINQEAQLKYHRLATNPSLNVLIQHPDLKKIPQNIKNYWNQHDSFIELLIRDLFQSQEYQDFLNLPDPSKNEYQKLLIYIFKNIIAPSSTLQEIYQDYSISFTDDLPLVNSYMLKVIKKMDEIQAPKSIIPHSIAHQKEIQFGINLLNYVLLNEKHIKSQHQKFIKNWTLDRLITIDSAILTVAIAELFYFEDIPPKVTINEYLEIANDYSTEKSAKFINGILDQLLNNR
ncbi:MAG: transcription antitermination factor NusB [Flavobacteriaceae bacterium]|nr:transcription antitermination factor NusB [Flavobacteriaceae bacterium]